MNVYDFDNTIYDGESVLDLFFFYVRRDPALIRYIPKVFHALFKYKAGKVTVEQAIEAGRTRLCAFCAKRDNINGVVTDKPVEEIEDIVDDAA